MIHFALGLVAGLLGWTLLEYIVHYVLGHIPKGKIFISREHLHHHQDITYFSPIPLKIRGAVPVLSLLFAVGYFAVSVWFAAGFTLAVGAGWTLYEWLHQAIHVRGPHTAYGRWAARHHLAHHFVRPDVNHGVTTPLWDILLGTHKPVTKISVRKKDADLIPWLAAGFAADAPPAFIADYELREPRAKKAEAA